LIKSPHLYTESEVALKSVNTIALKEPLIDIKEEMELMEICNMIFPNSNQSSKFQTKNKYYEGGILPNSQNI